MPQGWVADLGPVAAVTMRNIAERFRYRKCAELPVHAWRAGDSKVFALI